MKSDEGNMVESHVQEIQPEAKDQTQHSQSLKIRSSLISARAVQLSRAFESCKVPNSNQYTYTMVPPTASYLRESFEALGLPSKIYQPPYYSKDVDVPDSFKEYAGLVYRLKGGTGIAQLDEWSNSSFEHHSRLSKTSPPTYLESAGIGGWEYASEPPSVKDVRRSLQLDRNNASRKQFLKGKLTSQVAQS